MNDVTPGNRDTITDYEPAMARAIADLYHAAVHGIDDAIYSATQKEAWAPTPPDYHWWTNRLCSKNPLVYLNGGRVVAFIELEEDGHIDCFYTQPEYQQTGCSGRLYRYAEGLARELGLPGDVPRCRC